MLKSTTPMNLSKIWNSTITAAFLCITALFLKCCFLFFFKNCSSDGAGQAKRAKQTYAEDQPQGKHWSLNPPLVFAYIPNWQTQLSPLFQLGGPGLRDHVSTPWTMVAGASWLTATGSKREIHVQIELSHSHELTGSFTNIVQNGQLSVQQPRQHWMSVPLYHVAN